MLLSRPLIFSTVPGKVLKPKQCSSDIVQTKILFMLECAPDTEFIYARSVSNAIPRLPRDGPFYMFFFGDMQVGGFLVAREFVRLFENV